MSLISAETHKWKSQNLASTAKNHGLNLTDQTGGGGILLWGKVPILNLLIITFICIDYLSIDAVRIYLAVP